MDFELAKHLNFDVAGKKGYRCFRLYKRLREWHEKENERIKNALGKKDDKNPFGKRLLINQ